jgi:hypothetical protein
MLCSANSASCALGECGAFRAEGQYIADWMRAQNEVKEESITDSYLYRLSQLLPNIVYQSFSRWDEARRTGADWEWWFILPTRSLRLWVQAKKLRLGRNCRADLARKNKHGGQLAMLLKRARKNNAIPIYAFYSPDISTPNACGSVSIGHGVLITHAMSVWSLLRSTGKITDSKLIGISRAAACLPCCMLQPIMTGRAINVAGWLGPASRIDGDPFEESDGWHTTLPGYVQRLMRGRAIDKRPDFGLDGDAPANVGAVLVVQLHS